MLKLENLKIKIMENYILIGVVIAGVFRFIPQIYIPTLNAFVGFVQCVAIFLFPSKMERVLDIFNKYKPPPPLAPPPEIDSGNNEASLKESA